MKVTLTYLLTSSILFISMSVRINPLCSAKLVGRGEFIACILMSQKKEDLQLVMVENRTSGVNNIKEIKVHRKTWN